MTAGVRWVIPVLLAVSACAAGAEPAKPACNALTRGNLWPEKADRVSGVSIEICSKRNWRYHWQQLTVDVSQLTGKSRPKPVMATVAAVTRTAVAANAKPAATPPE